MEAPKNNIILINNVLYSDLGDLFILHYMESLHIHPSVFYLNGTQEWRDENGDLHRRNDLPAVEYANGDREWWFRGKRHRINGPAIIYKEKEYWYENGKFIK